MSYTLNYADKAEKFDEVVETDGTRPALSRRGGYSFKFLKQSVCACAQRTGAAARVVPVRSPAFHAEPKCTLAAVPVLFAHAAVTESKIV